MRPFADYMDEALYGPSGYYSSGIAKSGKSGDYFTAPDVGPIFGLLLSIIFKSWAEKLEVHPFTLMEVGAGEGRLAADITSSYQRKSDSILAGAGAGPKSDMRYLAVERSPLRRQVLAKIPSVNVLADLSDVSSMEGIIFGNELIDAFPVHRVRMNNGKLEELFVTGGVGPDLTPHWSSPSTPAIHTYFDRLKITLPEGYETEVNLAMASWLKQASRLLQKGLVVLIDYGRSAYDYYAPERTRGTLRTFSKHQVSSNFMDFNNTDLTADVDFTSLALDATQAGFTPLAFMELGTFLMQGVESLDVKGPAPVGLRYLLHPEGMGGLFHVLILGRNVHPAEWVFDHNRMRRLGLPA